MNALEMIAALKGADEETAAELVERLQCGEIYCSVLPTGKDSAVQQAQIWAQEARTQKGIVEEIGKLVGCANDWEIVSAVKAALSGAQQGAAPQPAQVPEGWRIFSNPKGVICLENTSSGESILVPTYSDRGDLWMRVAGQFLRDMLTAAPAPDHEEHHRRVDAETEAQINEAVAAGRIVDGREPDHIADAGKVECHAPGDRCRACPHYFGKADRCDYAISPCTDGDEGEEETHG